MIKLSLNEIYSETYKAMRSLGIDWGIAKDCAVLTRWLAFHDQYFLGSILSLMQFSTAAVAEQPLFELSKNETGGVTQRSPNQTPVSITFL